MFVRISAQVLFMLLWTASVGIAQSARRMEEIRAIHFVHWWLSARDHEGKVVFVSGYRKAKQLEESAFLNPYPIRHGDCVPCDSIERSHPYRRPHPARDTLFTWDDQQYLRAQYNRRAAKQWQPINFPGKHIIRRQQRITCFGKRSGFGTRKPAGCPDGYMVLAWPLCSLDGKRVLFYYGYHCSGLCGSGGIEVFEWKHGCWQQMPVNLEMWLS